VEPVDEFDLALRSLKRSRRPPRTIQPSIPVLDAMAADFAQNGFHFGGSKFVMKSSAYQPRAASMEMEAGLRPSRAQVCTC
jgi:hypothetical protein